MKSILFALLLIPIVSGLNISADYPDVIYSNSEFEINVESDSAKIFDIKIDVMGDGKRISRIFDGTKWASTIYYLAEGFSEKGKYEIKIENYVGSAEMIIRLREKDGKVTAFGPYDINISEEKTKESSDDEPEEKQTETHKTNQEKRIIDEKIIAENKTIELESIELNPKTIKTKENNLFLGKGVAKYSIAIFCVVLFFLYIRKPQDNKNEFGRDNTTKNYSDNDY